MSFVVIRLRAKLLTGDSNGVISTLYASTPMPLCLRRRRRRRPVNAPLTGVSSFSHFASNHSGPETPTPSLQPLNKKIAGLIRNNRVDEARGEFDRAKRRDVVTWNSMLSGYARRGDLVRARKLFDAMPERDAVSWNLMISGYASCRRHVGEARKLFDEMPARDSVSWNTMISGYAKCGDMSEASKLFNAAPEKNDVTWNALLTGFLANGDPTTAVRLFESLPSRRPDTFSALVSGLVRNGQLSAAERLLQNGGAVGDLVGAYNTLIAGYSRRGLAGEARRVFDKLRSDRNLVSWNSMLMCYLRAGDVPSARSLFDEMPERDVFSWNSMIAGYARASDMAEAASLFRAMLCRDTLTWNSMVSGFARIGDLGSARALFDETPRKNLVSWNSIISAHEMNGDHRGSVELFARMRRGGAGHDSHTLSSVLSACAGLADLSLGTQVHQLATKTLSMDLVTSNSAVTMYARCGAIREARAAFDAIGPRKDAISWNAMIGGYATHGLAAEALERFGAMKRAGTRPTRVTFVAVLNACANAGLVEEAYRQFGSMSRDFGIEPEAEHYASLVDVLARKGEIERAVGLIREMRRVGPDGSIWGAVLGACRVHGDARLARVAAEALARIEPESSAPYVLLYNVYAGLERWDDAAKVRLVMEENNVFKERGYSRVDSSSSHCLL